MLVSKAVDESLNVSVSIPAVESLPTQKKKAKKKKKGETNPILFKPEYPK